MSLLTGVADKRNFKVPEDKVFVLKTGEKLSTLDELSEAINLIEPETFQFHVNEQKNDFAAWVGGVFGEEQLSQQLYEHPTPLRMMVSIEKFLRQPAEGAAAPAAAEQPAQEMPAPAASMPAPMPEPMPAAETPMPQMNEGGMMDQPAPEALAAESEAAPSWDAVHGGAVHQSNPLVGTHGDSENHDQQPAA